MRQLRSVEAIRENTTAILRLDTDLPIEEGKILDNSRLKKSIPTIRYLLEKNCKLIIIGHLKRPRGYEISLSLKPIYLELIQLLDIEGQNTIMSVFVDDIKNEEKISKAIDNNQIIFIENIRFWEEEEKGQTEIFNTLKKYALVFINDAFAVAHRESASVIIHREMESYYGFSFVEEAEKITSILEEKQRPITIILGGAKEDKLKNINELLRVADHLLIGGKLPKLITNNEILVTNEKIKIAKLREDGLDLSQEDIDVFGEIINSSKTIIWAGAMGLYESENSQKGTREIAYFVANSSGYKIIAGGDTGASIKDLGLRDKIDFICSGGGVMLELLIKNDLPAWS